MGELVYGTSSCESLFAPIAKLPSAGPQDRWMGAGAMDCTGDMMGSDALIETRIALPDPVGLRTGDSFVSSLPPTPPLHRGGSLAVKEIAMALLPQSREQRIQFYEAHLPLWTAAPPAAIGLTAGQLTAINTLVTAARASLTAAETARIAAKDATANFYNKTGSMDALGTDLIKIIRAYAATQNDPNVYVLAGIPAPSSGSPVPPPGTPTNFEANLLQDGTVKLKWTCTNPPGAGGTIYEVRRRIGAPSATNPLTLIATTGSREFTDGTIPPGESGGADGILYQITAVRSTKRGNPAQFTIRIGAGGSLESFEFTGASTTGGEGENISLAA